MSLLEFSAGKCRLENKIALRISDEWDHVDVFLDWEHKHPLSGSFWMLDDIHIPFLQNQCSDFLKRDSSLCFELATFVFVPHDIHDRIVSHYMYNVNYVFLGGYRA